MAEVKRAEHQLRKIKTVDDANNNSKFPSTNVLLARFQSQEDKWSSKSSS